MKPWKRLLIYLLLNIIVTGITMLAVLYLWENTAVKELMYTTVEQAAARETPAVVPEGENPDTSGQKRIEIEEVGGVGNLATEYILLKHSKGDAQETVSLQNWVLRDEDGHEFSILAQSGIGSLELHAKGAVYVYTKTGQSNPIELYLGLQDPLWNPGETVTLLSPGGEIHDTYQIP